MGYSKNEAAPEISDNGYVGVSGMAWHDESDSVELKFQDLRGRLSPTIKTFKGDKTSYTDMGNYVPTKLNKCQVTSKFMGLFNLRGLLIPLTARLKRDLRRIVATTPGWDHGIDVGQRSTWQTLMKLVESDMNSTPFGRINSRIPAGPFRLPSGPKDMISRVGELYENW